MTMVLGAIVPKVTKENCTLPHNICGGGCAIKYGRHRHRWRCMVRNWRVGQESGHTVRDREAQSEIGCHREMLDSFSNGSPQMVTGDTVVYKKNMQHYIWCKQGIAYYHINISPTIKYAKNWDMGQCIYYRFIRGCLPPKNMYKKSSCLSQ